MGRKYGGTGRCREMALFASISFLSLLIGACFLVPDATDNNRATGCRVASDCEGDFRCGAGACIQPGAVGLAGACWANNDCEDGLYCSRQGLCGPSGGGGVGAVCGTGAECEKQLTCEAFGLTGSCVVAGASDVGENCEVPADCISGLTCDPDKTCRHPLEAFPPFEGVDCAPDSEEFFAFFEVPRSGIPLLDFYRLPFPTDIRDNENGTIDLRDFPTPGPGALGVDIVKLYVDALSADFQGFSSIAPVSFRFSAPVGFATLSTQSVHYVDITEGAPEFGDDRSRTWRVESSRMKYHCQNFLTVQNSESSPLLPGHSYAVYVTTDVRSDNGGTPIVEDDLLRLLEGPVPSDAALIRPHRLFEPFRAYLAADENISADRIAAATVFTVANSESRTRAVMEATLAAPLPVLSDLITCDGQTQSPCEDSTGRGACGPTDPDFYEIHGRASVPVFQSGKAPYEFPQDGGAVAFPPAVVRTENVCVAITIPKTNEPVDGFPVVVYAHGTGGSFRGAIENGIAKSLANAGIPMAVLAFDGVVHGDRRGDSTKGPDALMFNVVNPFSARDNNLQGAVDVAQMLRIPLQGQFPIPGVGSATLNPNSTFFFGHSQGSNVGIPAVATQNGASAAVFSGAGSYLTKALLTKTKPIDVRVGLQYLIGESLSISHPVMVIWQTFFDSVDTLNFAPLLIKRPLENVNSKDVFVTWGQDDSFSPVSTIAATAVAAGLPIAAPAVEQIDSLITETRPVAANITAGDGIQRTGALFQYDSSDVDGHFVAMRNIRAIADWLNFFQSAVNGNSPRVP